MCLSRTNQSAFKRNDTPNAPMETNHIADPENSTPRRNNPLTTPTPVTCISNDSHLGAKHVISEQSNTSSLFIQHLLEGLLATATSPMRRPSDVFETLPSTLKGHRSSPIKKANQPPTGASAVSSSDADSNASLSDDDTKVLPVVCEDSDTDHRKDTSLRTKHEKDENKIHISRPDFVATEQHTLVKVGTISGILDTAVVVTTFNLADVNPRLPNADITTATALDTGSLLCFPDGTLLGAVFDTFGPVASPLYVVRFNNSHEIPSATQVGQEIMYVEQEMSVVRARDVCRKGYDASGKDDEEVDAEDFSDDEKERRAKKFKRAATTDRTAGPLKRKRGPRERQRQRRSERPPPHTNVDFHRSTLIGVDENERRWANRNPYSSNQPSMRRSEADEHLSPQAHGSIQASTAASQPNFMTGGAGFMPPRYTAELPLSVPPTMNLPGTHGSSFHAHVTNAGYPVSYRPSPFSAPIAPFSEHMMPVPCQTMSYTQPWGGHANYDQYRPNRNPNPAQQPYHHIGHPMPSHAVRPSHPYHSFEHRPYGALNRDRARDPQHRDVIPNPNMDAQCWQRVSRQHDHM